MKFIWKAMMVITIFIFQLGLQWRIHFRL